MSYDKEEWRQMKKAANRGIVFVIGWILAAVAVLALISISIWYFNVVASGPKGLGDAEIEKNSSENWVAAQAEFERGYQDVLLTDQKITLAAQNLALNPTDKTAQQTLQGLQSYCLSAAAEYNANARSFLSEDFRAADLPSEISTTNPATDCK